MEICVHLKNKHKNTEGPALIDAPSYKWLLI